MDGTAQYAALYISEWKTYTVLHTPNIHESNNYILQYYLDQNFTDITRVSDLATNKGAIVRVCIDIL